jgi:DNA-binding transcriptional LysR family regulator
LTQAAVSAQMQRLESELGFALFDRIGRTARLNKMGQQVLLQAQELLRLYANLGSSGQGQPASISVQLGSIASLQRSLLPDALARLHQQFPQCRTRIIPGVSLQLMNLVDAGELDMAALIRPPLRCKAICAGRRWRTSPSGCWCRAPPGATTGPSCWPASPSYAMTGPRSAAGRWTVSCAACTSR